MIYCTRKIYKDKLNTHTELSFRLLKNYSIDLYKEALRRTNFPNYEIFDNIDTAYDDFVSKINSILESLAPIKTVRVKGRSSEWFDGEVLEKIKTRNSLFKKFKHSRLCIDEQLYKEARNLVLTTIRNKKRTFFKEKLQENVSRPKELWKTLKKIGLPKKKTLQLISA